MEALLERARVLLDWPTQRKILQLAQRFPEEEWWQYAVGMLEKAKRPNEAYLVSCLETARAEGRHKVAQKLGPYPGGFGDRGCPWCPGLYCPWAKACQGWQDCQRTQSWLLKLLRDINSGGRQL